MIFLSFEAMRTCNNCMTASKTSSKRFAIPDENILDDILIMENIKHTAVEVLRHLKATNLYDSFSTCETCRQPFVSPVRIVKNDRG